MLILLNSLPVEIENFCRKEAGESSVVSTLDKKDLSYIGEGSHGEVYELTDSTVIKYFNSKGKQGNNFDYLPLKNLQGIAGVPVLYAYCEKEFVVMEKAKGLKLDEYFTTHGRLPSDLKVWLKDLLEEFSKKKWFFDDINIYEDVFITEDKEEMTLVDYSLYLHLPQANENQANRTVESTYNALIENLQMNGYIIE